MVVPIALLGANGAILNHGAVVTKEELTGSVETLLEEGFIVEHKESKADKDAAEAKAKEEADKAASENKDVKGPLDKLKDNNKK